MISTGKVDKDLRHESKSLNHFEPLARTREWRHFGKFRSYLGIMQLRGL